MTAHGVWPLAEKLPARFVVYAPGRDLRWKHSPTRPLPDSDHQQGYIDFWLMFIGVKEIHTLVVEGTTWGGKEQGGERLARGQEVARKLAAQF